MKTGGLLMRAVTTVVVVPLMLALIWVAPLHPFYSLFIAGLAVMGLYEYYVIIRGRKIEPEMALGMTLGGLVALSGHFGNATWTAGALYAAVVVVCVGHMFRQRQSAEGTAASVFGLLYVGWFFSHMTLLRAEPVVGPGLATLVLVTVAVTDAGAYGTGRLLGRHKLAPGLSPNKTWEGAVGGLVLSVGAALGVCAFSEQYAVLPQWTPFQYGLIGGVMSVVAQFGDLAESAMKRSGNVKDSGFLFPGHGGVLDRCDGYLFAAPVLYYMVVFFRAV